ncbi:hypothetical protein [Polycyclovorans algicola]|uniref:hypothetical protein n=1 Tax=Polycyclovorans algicola TaxID=616992 RepID=UPI0004A7009F|nr:hypothetical protein [Polycyclovorans algicola]
MSANNADGAVVSAPARAAFLSMAARYEVADSARLDDLLNDAGCFLDCAYETVNTLAHGLTDSAGDIAVNSASTASMLFGVGYLIKMAGGATNAAHSRSDLATASNDELLDELRRRGLIGVSQGGGQ